MAAPVRIHHSTSGIGDGYERVAASGVMPLAPSNDTASRRIRLLQETENLH